MKLLRSWRRETMLPGNRPEPLAAAVLPPVKDASMGNRGTKLLKLGGVGVAGLVLIGILAAAILWKPGKKQNDATVKTDISWVTLVARQPATVRVLPETVESLGIQTRPAQEAKKLRPLEMFGQLAPNQGRLIRIRPLFAGKVIEIKQIQAVENGKTIFRPLRVGDPVEKNQVVAVILSPTYGQTKSDLVSGLEQLRTDQDYLKDLEAYPAAVSRKSLRDAQHNVKADQIAIDRAERTLRSWGISEAEIKALKAEAKSGGKKDKNQFQKWARYEVRAPNFDGIVLEKNVTEGENIDPSTGGPPLFQIGDYSTLTIYAYPYEEDLPLLQEIKQKSGVIPWTIVPKAQPNAKFKGTVDLILPNIDPNQKTPILQGHVENARGQLRSNMSFTVTIDIPAPAGEVTIPATALVDDGEESIVFLQPDPTRPEYQLQHVVVVRRYADEVFVRSKLSPEEEKRAAQQGGLKVKPQPLHPGQRVVASGANELKSALDSLLSQGSTVK